MIIATTEFYDTYIAEIAIISESYVLTFLLYLRIDPKQFNRQKPAKTQTI